MDSSELLLLRSHLDKVQTERLRIEVQIDELRMQRDTYLNEEDEIEDKLNDIQESINEQ